MMRSFGGRQWPWCYSASQCLPSECLTIKLFVNDPPAPGFSAVSLANRHDNRQTVCERTMGNHYVPQELLRGFQSPSDPGTIWAYDKTLRRFAHIPIKLAAQETGYYDEQTEKDLSELLEGPAHSALTRARAGEVIFGQDRTWLGLYAASMLWRGPRRRRKSFAIVPSVLASTVSELKAQILRLAEENKIDRAVLEERLAEFDRVHDKVHSRDPAGGCGSDSIAVARSTHGRLPPGNVVANRDGAGRVQLPHG